MAKIFSGAARIGSARLVDPVARSLLRLGISPDAVTLVGTAGVVAGAIWFGARGQFLVGALVVVLFALVDMVDGGMARARGYSTRFGALLDSTMDRIADGAVLGAVVYWYASQGESPTVAAGLLCLVASQVISYVKARAQSVGIACDVGLVERPERLVLLGLGALGTGLGLGWALPVALWVLGALSLVTIAQRVLHVRRADLRAREAQARETQETELPERE
ncbi:MAG TPA: CDP-alcohol phosphatidyltransferase family protein [Natronosporangium sp.]